jgi:hypothetical protein
MLPFPPPSPLLQRTPRTTGHTHNKQTNKPTNKQTNTRTNKQTNKHTNKQTNKQTFGESFVFDTKQGLSITFLFKTVQRGIVLYSASARLLSLIHRDAGGRGECPRQGRFFSFMQWRYIRGGSFKRKPNPRNPKPYVVTANQTPNPTLQPQTKTLNPTLQPQTKP